MRTALLCAAAVALAAPASADAAKLSLVDGTLTYTGDPGGKSVVRLDQPDPAVPTTVTVFRVIEDIYPLQPSDTDPITATGCSPHEVTANLFVCNGVTHVAASLEDGDDQLNAFYFGLPITVSGGPGDDLIDGGLMSDSLSGGEGDDNLSGSAGDDLLQGGDGDDTLEGGSGADRLSGGAGFDNAVYWTGRHEALIAITLDGVADDGLTGEHDDFAADIEDVEARGSFVGTPLFPGRAIPSVVLTGSAAANTLTTDIGDDRLTGGAGNDVLNALGGDDTIDARDGFADRVRCGGGTDTVLADTLDTVSRCEDVQVADLARVLPAEDAPPAVGWATQAPARALPANRVTTLQATASDDRGVAAVRFLDDDRLVCEDTSAPYTCGYRARDEDVGRNTFTLVAVDAAGQTASTQRAVTVSRFTAALSLSVNARRDRIIARGRLVRPASADAPCSGTVTVTAKAGKRTVASRRARLNRRCTYRISVRDGGAEGRLRVRARFSGDDVFAPSRSPARTVRTG